MAIADWSTVAADNGTVLGVNIAENCPAANMNNALRQAMADVAGGINFSTLGTFLASTTLANARTALGVGAGSTSATNFDLLTNTANKVPYMTGSNNWATADLTSFARTLLAAGDAAAARTVLSAAGATLTGTASSGTLDLGIFRIKWVDGTAAPNASTVLSYNTPFTSWSRAVCNGHDGDTGSGDNKPAVSTSSTTGATVVNGSGVSISTTVIAIGV